MHKAHSVDWLYDDREAWWNLDYLRFRVHPYLSNDWKSLLDVGVGRGHWTRLVASLATRPLRIEGLDIEPRWVAESIENLSSSTHQYHAQQGDAYNLPFPDATFDVVTCQTVLMHLQAPETAISEMHRVLRPGGTVVLAEPTNQLNRISFVDMLVTDRPAEGSAIWYAWACYHRALKVSGSGDNNMGIKLANLVTTAGFEAVSCYHNDKTFRIPIGPESLLQMLTEFDRPEVRSLMRDGGASDAEIESARSATDNLIAALGDQAGEIASPLPLYLCLGRKPA